MSFLPWQESVIMKSLRVAAARQWEVSQGEGISGPEHSALAKYILSNDAMAHDHELGGVGNYHGNQAVKAHRDKRHVTNRADKEARKEKVLKK